jgi:AcrR family transcriptional regulator
MAIERLHTDVRQEQFAAAALSIIGSDGVKGLSIARVAHRVGLVPSAVYRHFKGKDELLDAVIGLIRSRLLGNVAAVCAENTDSFACLKSLLMRHVELIRTNQGIQRLVFSEEMISESPDRKRAIHGMVRHYLKQVADIIRRGQQTGQIKPDLDAGVLSMMFLGLIQPAAVLWRLSDGGVDVTRHAEKAWQIFHTAIAADPD